jgi:hypothetical protein
MPPGEDEIRESLERSRGGDALALAELRGALDRHPEIWRSYGDLAGHAIGAWVGLIAGQDLALKESLERRLDAMRKDLAGPSPTPLESLLVERALASWLQVCHADLTAARGGAMSIKQAEFARKRQDSAHRRHLAAVAALATVRKLLGAANRSSGGDPRRSIPFEPEVVVEGGGRGSGGADDGTAVGGLVLEFGRSPGGRSRRRRPGPSGQSEA